MTKTAEVIKNTLRICANSGVDSCNDCPYRDSGEAACVDSVEADALEYIERLEAEKAKLKGMVMEAIEINKKLCANFGRLAALVKAHRGDAAEEQRSEDDRR